MQMTLVLRVLHKTLAGPLLSHLNPLSLALSREGRGGVLFEDIENFMPGHRNKLSVDCQT